MTEEEEYKLICNSCKNSVVVDQDNIMYIHCKITLLFCYSIKLPDYELVEEGQTCEGRLCERRPIWQVH